MPSATTSDYQHHEFMKLLFHGEHLWADGWTTADTFHIGLMTSAPPLASVAPFSTWECVDPGTFNYARATIGVGVGNWGSSGLEYSNTPEITFPNPIGGNWGLIVGAGIFDAGTAGNLLYYADLTTNKQVSDQDGAPKILTGQLRITRAYC